MAYRAEDGSGILARNAVRDGDQMVDPSDLMASVTSVSRHGRQHAYHVLAEGAIDGETRELSEWAD